MLAVIINGLGASLGAVLGVILHRGIPERFTKSLFSAIALCVIVMAVQGAIQTENLLLVLASVAVGVVCGTWIGIEDHMERGGQWLRKKLHAEEDASFVNALVTLSIMQLVGALSIIGPVQAALLGDASMLYFKSLLDTISGFIFGAVYGIGTIPVGIIVIIYEMFFFVLAGCISPLMTADVIRELNAVGSVMILGIGFNMLGVTKLRIADYLPGLCVPVVYYHILAYIG